MIVCAFVLPAPGIDGLADDVEARVTGLAGEFAATAERVRELGDALTGWTAVFRGAGGTRTGSCRRGLCSTEECTPGIGGAWRTSPVCGVRHRH
jgi:hypothetical protein